MKVLTESEVHACGIATLGLDPAACDLATIEAVAGAFRRAAGFLCPCSRKTLLRAVQEPLKSLVDEKIELQELLEDTLEAMIAYGDLIEERDLAGTEQGPKGTLLYAAPPSFVWRQNRSVLILGIVPDHLSPLPHDLERRIEHVNYVRCISEQPGEELQSYLSRLGLVRLSSNSWTKAPQRESSFEYVRRLDRRFEPVSGTIPGLILLNPARPVRYYPGRWEEVKEQSGRFVARRSQAYGNDLWCYVEFDCGRPRKILEFPTSENGWRGCDEAWHLQAAIDASRGTPQLFRVRLGPDRATQIIDFFSPVPMWARRRWEIIGEPVMSTGCLFSYRFPVAEMAEEVTFIQEELWLAHFSG